MPSSNQLNFGNFFCMKKFKGINSTKLPKIGTNFVWIFKADRYGYNRYEKKTHFANENVRCRKEIDWLNLRCFLYTIFEDLVVLEESFSAVRWIRNTCTKSEICSEKPFQITSLNALFFDVIYIKQFFEGINFEKFWLNISKSEKNIANSKIQFPRQLETFKHLRVSLWNKWLF